jgi:branched-chain amino acid aminotransferase
MMETLMLNSHGYLAEATGDNIFLVHKGVVFTPPEEAGILLGITRQAVMDLACEAGIPVVEKNLNRYDLFIADECFLTGSAAEIISVTKADGRIIGAGVPGPITLNLLERFRQLTLAN